MSDRKTKQRTETITDSLYRKVIQKTNKTNGDFQGQTLIEIKPWEFKESKGVSLHIKVDKMGFGEKKASSSFVYVDLGNEEIRNALKEAISVVENQ